MGNCSDGPNATDNSQAGTLLYVTDLVNDSDESLDFACQLAEKQGIHLELVHVVDVGHSPSRPDAQMGIQYRLEALASRLRRRKTTVVSSLLFGSPEDVISKRASAIKAKLIAFAGNSSSSARSQKGLVIRLKQKVGCPVVVLSGSVIRGR
jgi:nucleotide-binding universal stress UspA family protein